MQSQLNGAAVTAGYWTDRDGHKVYLCEGQFLPSCPKYPFQNTYWILDTEIPCPEKKVPNTPSSSDRTAA